MFKLKMRIPDFYDYLLDGYYFKEIVRTILDMSDYMVFPYGFESAFSFIKIQLHKGEITNTPTARKIRSSPDLRARAFIVALCVLTFTVILYDFRVFNTKVLWIRAFGLPKKVVDITDHPLKEGILHYVNESRRTGNRIYIINNPKIEDFFWKYAYSSWCGTCMMYHAIELKDGNTYYTVMVSYSKIQPSLLDSSMASIVSIATFLLWVHAVSSTQKLKTEEEVKKNESVQVYVG